MRHTIDIENKPSFIYPSIYIDDNLESTTNQKDVTSLLYLKNAYKINIATFAQFAILY